jgi:hypothetical protein
MIWIAEIKTTQEIGTFRVKRMAPAGLRRKLKRAAAERRRRKLEKRTKAWQVGLEMTGGGTGLIGAAGIPLLRLLAEESALRGRLSKSLTKPGFIPGHDRGQVLIDVAIGLALGTVSAAETARELGSAAPVVGPAASAPTIWRTFDDLDEQALARVATARAAHRRLIWAALAERPGGFPWVEVAGQVWKDWIVLDVDATLVETHSEKEGAAPTFKKHIFGLHPLTVSVANTGEELVIYLRKGNAGSNTADAAPRGALSYPHRKWEELGRRFLGLMAYLDPKGEGDKSMPGKQRSCSGV